MPELTVLELCAGAGQAIGLEMAGFKQRETFRTSRLLDFFSEKELVAQTV